MAQSERPAAADLESRAAVDGALFRQIVADGYDACAEAYLKDHAVDDPDDMRAGPFVELLVGLPEGASVLDVGCGAGVPIAKAVVDDRRQMRVTGVDISPRQIELANELVPSDRATFICGDMSSVAFENESFDAVCAFFSVFHIPRRDHESFFKRVASWLRPGGSFVFNLGAGLDDGEGDCGLETDFLGATMVWSSHPRDRTMSILSAAGLTVVKDELKTVTAGDEVDDAGLQFRFYHCRKPGGEAL